MRIVVMNAFPCKLLDNVAHVLPLGSGEVDLSIERLEEVLADIARQEHCVLGDDIRGIIAGDKVRELVVVCRAGRCADEINAAAVQIGLEDQALLRALLVLGDIVESEISKRTGMTGRRTRGGVDNLVLLVGQFKTCVRVRGSGSLRAGSCGSGRSRVGRRRTARSHRRFIVARGHPQNGSRSERACENFSESWHLVLPFLKYL